MLESWFGDKSSTEASIERSAEQQAAVDAATEKLALYHYDTCWYCGRVKSAMAQLRLNIELRNIHRDPEHHAALISGGGSGTVPCLAIEDDNGETQWLYESQDIIAYLGQRFGAELS